jgi:dimethylamine/trimethylamine dehydrogenase
VCVAGDLTMAPIRCTQNPSMGEEWRRGWHPERLRPKESDASVLVVGAGPAGLEAATSLGRRGYAVVLAEASQELGGRVAVEARLPGLAAWIRVVDHRRLALRRLPAVELAFGSRVSADEILEYGFAHVAVATGARWRDDGVGRFHAAPAPLAEGPPRLTPDDLLAGTRPAGEHVVLFDDDHYYLGGVLAELLAREGRRVTLVTTAAVASAWTVNTLEQHRIQRRLLEAGVRILASHALTGATANVAEVTCTYTGRTQALPCQALVLVTARLPQDGLVTELERRSVEWEGAGLQSLRAIGDAYCPATIAAAVWDGRRFAEELDAPPPGEVGFRREHVGAPTY